MADRHLVVGGSSHPGLSETLTIDSSSMMDPPSGFLPLDLILLILSRLPIKPLLRCRAVCRSWRRSLSSAHFARLHSLTSSAAALLLLELPHPRPSLLCLDPSAAASDLPLDFLRDRVKLRAASRGLLCCSSTLHRGVFYVCNPATRQSRRIPPTTDRPVSRFHPDCEASLVGLAVDPSGSKFHLALAGFRRIFGHRPDDRLACQVFDSGTNTWRRFASLPLDDEFTHMNRNQAVHSHGMLHWLTASCSYVLALDPDHEAWGKIMLPDEICTSGRGGRMYLLELEGLVSVVRMLAHSMSIWVLEDHTKEKWVLADRVNLGCIGAYAASAFPVCQSRDVVLLATQTMVLTYGRKSKEWKVIYTVNCEVTYPLWFSAYAFRSSLFSCW